MQAFDYQFNVGGDFVGKVNQMNEAVGTFSAKVESAQGWVLNLKEMLASLEQAIGWGERPGNTFQGLAASGVRLDSQMHDLSAVAGVTGDALKEIEGYARSSAKAFGTDAGTAVEGYKLLLSQLTPELGKCPAALKSMGESIQITSKLMGGDGVAAAQVLTTAMNQYGVSMDDPIAASRTMAEMMNTMAAAGQAGSAELPAIKEALQQCGMAAKAAGVSFEETNAAIQVLDKAGKKGSEGGVALRNVMSTLAKGRFLPKDVKEELAAVHVNVKTLTDTSLSLEERLTALKPVMDDQALLSKLDWAGQTQTRPWHKGIIYNYAMPKISCSNIFENITGDYKDYEFNINPLRYINDYGIRTDRSIEIGKRQAKSRGKRRLLNINNTIKQEGFDTPKVGIEDGISDDEFRERVEQSLYEILS